LDLNLIGSAAIWAALLGAVASAIAAYGGGARDRPDWTDLGRYGTYFVFACMTVAVGAMEVALLTHDFSVQYVAEVGSRDIPNYYTAISLWSSLDGSILFWGWILAGYSALVSFVNRERYRQFMPYVVGTMMVVGVFFFGILAGPLNPFGVVSPVPANGPGPNALLQNHPLMGLHPPMLYLGYVGLTVPFAFAIAALLAGRLDATWIRATRRWMIAPWAFLSAGIVAGAWWSYEVLGWGGYWAWDPVENASFLPWLTATAFLHSVMVQERRGMLRTWNLSLIIGTFLLTVLGTFLTRSGVLDSVHAFTEGAIGPLLMGFMAVVTLVSLGLIAWRSDRLRVPGKLDGVLSRESAFILNNLLFVAFTFTVLLGTLFPLVVEAMQGERISVGSPYFNMVTVPIGLAILFLMGVGPALPWRRTSADRMKREFWIPSVVGALTAGISWVAGVHSVYPLLTFGFAGFVMTTIVEEFRKGVSARQRIGGVSVPKALLQLFQRNNRRYGGYVVHTGIVVVIVALAASGTWRFEKERTLERGESLQIGEYQVQLDDIWAQQEPRRFVVGSTFSVWQAGERTGQLEPSLNFYESGQGSGQPIATPAVKSSLTKDLYLSVMAFDRQEGRHATIRAIVNPMVPWLWIGGMIVALGAALSMWPQRKKSGPAALEEGSGSGGGGSSGSGADRAGAAGDDDREAA